uniref:Uncharacterized protein n=1 Tax=Salvator merianae TaxID=96440 RepID=A0A8D0E9M4_SALMN
MVPETWHEIINLKQKWQRSTQMKQSYTKPIYRWYRTPYDIARVIKSQHTTSWRGCQSYPTYFHMWWECEEVDMFWKMIHQELRKVFKTTIPLDPHAYILHDFTSVQVK